MGRITFESLPGKKPLKDRINIVLSRDETFENSCVTICRSIDELLQELKKYNNHEVYSIGGEDVYRQLLPYCDEALVTKIEHQFDADKYFLRLDSDKDWEMISVSDAHSYNNILFRFTKYVKLNR